MFNNDTRLFIIERQRRVKFMAKKGYSAAKISKKLNKIKNGIYSASETTVLRDIKVINAKRAKWDKIHTPHQMDKYQLDREALITSLDVLIKSAREEKQYKTAGDLITKKSRLLGIDKFVAPKAKKKDDIEAKYEHKTDEEVNEILFNEYKELTAVLIRAARGEKLNNIKKISVGIWRQDKDGNNHKLFITRFGDEKEISREREKIK